MIILAFSDSHGSTYSIDAAIEHESRVDAIIFCGDIARDAEYIRSRYPMIPLYAVCGNNDFFCSDPYLLLPTIEGMSFYITHGHKERVKFGCNELLSHAASKNCKVCIFGHTHSAVNEEKNGIHLINPGSIRSSRGTYAKIEISCGNFKAEIKSVE